MCTAVALRACSMVSILALIAGAAPGQESASSDQSEWVALFDGESLDGWQPTGGEMTFRTEGGTIIGAAVAGQPNGFLRTEKTFGDFELELQLKIEAGLNSGVQIRSQSRAGGGGRNRVFGYQVEVDTSERAWSGGIYDEGRRGWIHNLADNEAARQAFRVDEWNTYRVLCVGDRIRTWVNGVPAADLIDSMDPEGFIALQVHGIGGNEAQVGRTVRWKDIRIRELGKHEWQPLWNGRDLAGWQPLPGGHWEVDEASGLLVGRSPASESRHGVLMSDRTFGDFTARIRFRAIAGNSGFYIRSESVDSRVRGIQVEIDPAKPERTGGLYETGGRQWIVQLTKEDAGKWLAGDQFQELTVAAHGERLVVHLNGVRTVDRLDPKGRGEGRMGIQLHGGEEMHIEVQSVDWLVPAPERQR